MKKTLIIAGIIAIIVAGVAVVALGYEGQMKSMGPAPNSGDCTPDGSGFESFGGVGSAYIPGPAPNLYDGYPDGRVW